MPSFPHKPQSGTPPHFDVWCYFSTDCSVPFTVYPVLLGTAPLWLMRDEVPTAVWKEARWSSLTEKHGCWAAKGVAAEMAG